jgi:chromosome partitioning protein
MKVVSTINCKGGVGKTTVAACIGQALALMGHRVLAIDNDSQHNLSIMLDGTAKGPTVRDVYQSSLGGAGRKLEAAIRPTAIPNLDILPSCNELSNSDIRDTQIIKKSLLFCQLNQRYDYVLIDNPPGMDKLQEAALHASDEVFVPTELTHFAFSGIQNLRQMLKRKFGGILSRFHIIPNFYRSNKLQNGYLDKMRGDFPGAVTRTTIPFDTVLEECVTEGKILFVHRSRSRVTESYLKLVHELFNIDENEVRLTVKTSSRKALDDEERERFIEQNPISMAKLFPFGEEWDAEETGPCRIPDQELEQVPFFL